MIYFVTSKNNLPIWEKIIHDPRNAKYFKSFEEIEYKKNSKHDSQKVKRNP